MMRKYLLPVALGFVGMVLAHILILLGFGLGIKYPLYFIDYPVVFALIGFVLTSRHPHWWISNVICICIIPFIYWYLLLWKDGEFHFANAIEWKTSSGMILVLPFTLIVAALIAYSEYRHKTLTRHKS
jgi:hypothetical protein